LKLRRRAGAACAALAFCAALLPAAVAQPDAAREAYERGLAKRSQKDCRGAMADFDRALELRPDYFHALYQRGNCRQALGRYEQAIADYTRAAGLPGRIPPRFLAYYARGDAQRRLARLELALKDYSMAASLRTDTTALRSRGWVNFYLGRWNDAFADLSSYVHGTEAKEPDAAYAVILATLALERAGRGGDARQYLAQWEPRLDAKAWPAPVIALLKGGLGEKQLLAAASGSGQKTEALAYLGERLLASGDSAAGTGVLRRVLREGEPGYLEYDLAYHELRRMGLAKPADRRERKPEP
jgi:tetratricopeptide (TPR) repeat protein